MKKLFLVRHAKTEPLTSSVSDFERKLKKRGHIDSKMVANELISKRLQPDLIISSPAVRALETAYIMAEAFSIQKEKILIAPFIYDGNTTSGFLAGIASLAGENNIVMVVGHNPDMAMLSMKLTNESFFNYPTTATAVISFTIDSWDDMEAGKGKLETFIFPKMLKE